MDYIGLFEASLQALLRNRARSLLTVVGITIGIAAVICVVAIGNAGQKRVEQQMNNLGDNFVWVEAGGRAVNGVRTGTHAVPTLTMADADALLAQVPVLKRVSPNVDNSIQLVYGNRNWYTRYNGVAPSYLDVRRWEIDQGDRFTSEDVERAADVCVLGRTVRNQLFGSVNPIGKVIRAGSLPCKVVGTLKPKGLSVSGTDQDDDILIPYTTAQKKIKGISWLDDILGSAVSRDTVKLAGREAAAVLRDRHHLRPGEDDDFNIRNPEDIIQAQLESSRTLALLLVAVASISLFVGGIGIMNVMLVSVTERTREIGVRIAVGATDVAIQIQFLIESVLLSLVGGAAGVLMGAVACWVIGRALQWSLAITPESVLIAAVFSSAVGVFFGFYPAYKASRLDPIEALRFE